jgi:hypothetical protein
MNAETPYARALETHYAAAWGRPPADRLRWPEGPAGDLPADFCVLRFRRSGEAWAYATRGMSRPADGQKLELHLLAPARAAHEPADPGLVELLTAVAHYHRTGAPLGLGHTVNFGRPWQPGSACTRGLVSLPYLDGPALERLEATGTRCLWLLPVTPSEVEFKKRHGLEALEERFERPDFNYLDPRRPPVV